MNDTQRIFFSGGDRLVPRIGLLLLCGLLLATSACDTTTPTPTTETSATPVSLSFTAQSDAAKNASQTDAGVVFTDSSGATLRLSAVQMVLREIEFERAEPSAECESGAYAADDDDCEEVERGPLLVSLPLTGASPAVVLETRLPPGKWRAVEFDVHPLDDDNAADSTFLAEHDFPEDVSIAARGMFGGKAGKEFSFQTDLNEEKEITFSPPIEVTGDSPKNITFAVDLNRWFRQADGSLVNPAQAGDGERYEDLVEDNIEASIEGFEDDDRDGTRDRDDREDEGHDDDPGDDEDGSDDNRPDDDGSDDDGSDDDGSDDDGSDDDGSDDDGSDDDGSDDDEAEDEYDDDASETEVEVDLENVGPDPDASGDAEFEQEDDRTEFKVEVEDLEEGAYDLRVGDTVRATLKVTPDDDGTEGEVEFRDPAEPGHPQLTFDPRGQRVTVERDGTVYLEVAFPDGS